MTNPIRGEAVLKLKDKREFTLVLDFEALVAAESVYGKPLAHVLVDAKSGFIGAMRALLFGATREHHPDVTLNGATAIFMSDGDAVSAALEVATASAFPEAAGDKERGKARPPRGKTSGGSGAKPDSNRKGSGKQPRARSK